MTNPHHIFCLAGPPASGKSTTREALCESYPEEVKFLKRITTRTWRPGDDGEIKSLPEDEFIARARRGEIAAPFCAHRNMYGLCLKELTDFLEQGPPQKWIGCISASTGLELRGRGYPITIIHLTVRKRLALRQRLESRGTCLEEIEMRLHEYDHSDEQWRKLSADHVVYTDEHQPEETTQEVVSILGLPVLSTIH